MTQSSLTIMNFRKKFESGLLTPPADNSMAVRVRLETDNFYSREGELRFADISVDESTGMVLLRAVFPNPDTVLLPGMYVRAFLNVGTQERAFLVPQLAVQRDPRGVARLFVVAADGTAEQREVTTGDRVGRFWIISSGLSEGEKVVIEGLSGLRPGMKLKILSVKHYAELAEQKKTRPVTGK